VGFPFLGMMKLFKNLWVVFNNNVNNFVAIERLTVGSPVEVAVV